jgi:hypothetical protein
VDGGHVLHGNIDRHNSLLSLVVMRYSPTHGAADATTAA